jgi:hypothetical protein
VRLRRFETAFGKQSDEFLAEWERGELPATDEFFAWAGLCSRLRVAERRSEVCFCGHIADSHAGSWLETTDTGLCYGCFNDPEHGVDENHEFDGTGEYIGEDD